ncbi:hypothetical protein quinque_016282 [Culex quinquefasciatus]
MSRKKFSRWCLYFHHYCLLFLGQYPFCYDRARRRFRTSYPLLVVTISLKLVTVVLGPFASLRYLESVRSMPVSILPVALNFISDEIYWYREVALLVLFLTNSSGFRDTLNNSIALEQQLTKHFDVPRGTNPLYEALVVLKLAVASSCVVSFCSASVGGVLENAYTILSITLFLKGFFFADQFVICLEMICANLELLSSSLGQLTTELAHVFAGYDELRYCENLNRVAIAHSKIYRQFNSISQLFAAPMLLWLLLLYNGVILVVFLELTYAYLMLNDLGEVFPNKLIVVTMFVLFCADIWLLVRISTCIRERVSTLDDIH